MRRANARGVRRARSQPASPQLLCLALSCACGLAAASADILGSGANSSGKHHRGLVALLYPFECAAIEVHYTSSALELWRCMYGALAYTQLCLPRPRLGPRTTAGPRLLARARVFARVVPVAGRVCASE